MNDKIGLFTESKMKGNKWAKSMDFFVSNIVVRKWNALLPLCQKELRTHWMNRLKSNRGAWQAEALNESSAGFDGVMDRKLHSDGMFQKARRGLELRRCC